MTGNAARFPEIAYIARRTILRSSVASEMSMLAHALKRIADGRRRSRDFTFTSLRRVLEETIASLSVYRTYVRPDGVCQPHDEAHVRHAIAVARRRNPMIDPSIFSFLRSILLLEEKSEECVYLAMRFQQFTAAVMAKGVEDTALYRYPRLLSACEVGCDPGCFASSPLDLHRHNGSVLARWPLSMTATSTHDTKRSEDVRTRLAVLSEMPEEWRSTVERLRTLAARHLGETDGEPAPSPHDEYVFYQTVLGAWPYQDLPDQAARAAFADRIEAYMLKAAREAKLHTAWVTPNAAYEGALSRFVRSALEDTDLFSMMEATVAMMMPHAASNSLAQLALRLASPGVPDVYQGTELWDLSLVDPDNRRPVDYVLRKKLLAELRARASSPLELARELVLSYRDGRIKLHVLSIGLQLRRAHPDLFLQGAYRPLEHASPHVVAFERAHGPLRLAVVAPRLTRRLSPGSFALGSAWREMAIDLGPNVRRENVFTGQVLEGATLRLADVLGDFPVAWLLSKDG